MKNWKILQAPRAFARSISKVTACFLALALVIGSFALFSGEALAQEAANSLDSLPEVVEFVVENAEKNAVALSDDGAELLDVVVVENDDGTNTLHSFPYAVKYEDDMGRVRFRENKIGKDSFAKRVSNRLKGNKYDYHNEEGRIKTYFSDDANTGVKMVVDDYSVAISPALDEEILPTTQELTEAANLPILAPEDEVESLPEGTEADVAVEITENEEEEEETEVASDEHLLTEELAEEIAQSTELTEFSDSEVEFSYSDSLVTYDRVFTENTAIEYAPTMTGFKENIVLNQYDGVNTFYFNLTLEGLVPMVFHARGASIPLLDAQTNELALFIGQVDAKDATYGTELDDGTHFELDHEMFLTQGETDDEYLLTVVVNKDFLENPNTVYPVVIDPSVSVAASSMHDAPVYSGYTSSNFNTNIYNHVGYVDGSYKEGISFVQMSNIFHYRWINPAKITAVTYDVYETSGKSSSATVQLYDTNKTWQHTSIKHSNMPGVNGNPITSKTIASSTTKSYSFDIKSLFVPWLQRALTGSSSSPKGKSYEYGFMLKMSATGVSSRVFNSANNGTKPPAISITYETSTPFGKGNIYYIKNVGSSLYMTANSNNTVTQENFNGSKNQQWQEAHDSTGLYTLKNIGTGKFLTVGAATTMTASVAAANNANTQKFYINQNVGESSYRIHSREYRDGAYSIEIDNASTAAGAKVKKFGWQGGAYKTQFWVFENIADPSTYGCGLTYRSVTGYPPNCMAYTLGKSTSISISGISGKNASEDYIDAVIAKIKSQGFGCRSISSYDSTINRNEYRVAFRWHQKGDGFHIVMQLSDGTWAGKNYTEPSIHFKTGNPSEKKHEMWWDVYTTDKNDKNIFKSTSYTTNVVYFAVEK